METLSIPSTEFTPKIYFNPNQLSLGKYLFEISGECRPIDAKKFFLPVFQWIREFKREENFWLKGGRKIRIKFKLNYFNSPSAKCIYDIIQRVDELQKAYKDMDFKIIWTYDEFDEDIKKAGEEFSTLTKVPFHIVLNYLYVEPTANTPKIIVNTEKRFIDISGKSYGENLQEVYQPLFDWIDQYGHHYFKNNFSINLKLQYFNSPSVRIIRDIVKKLNKFYVIGYHIDISCFYDDDDDTEDMEMIFKGLEIPYKMKKFELNEN